MLALGAVHRAHAVDPLAFRRFQAAMSLTDADRLLSYAHEIRRRAWRLRDLAVATPGDAPMLAVLNERLEWPQGALGLEVAAARALVAGVRHEPTAPWLFRRGPLRRLQQALQEPTNGPTSCRAGEPADTTAAVASLVLEAFKSRVRESQDRDELLWEALSGLLATTDIGLGEFGSLFPFPFARSDGDALQGLPGTLSCRDNELVFERDAPRGPAAYLDGDRLRALHATLTRAQPQAGAVADLALQHRFRRARSTDRFAAGGMDLGRIDDALRREFEARVAAFAIHVDGLVEAELGLLGWTVPAPDHPIPKTPVGRDRPAIIEFFDPVTHGAGGETREHFSVRGRRLPFPERRLVALHQDEDWVTACLSDGGIEVTEWRGGRFIVVRLPGSGPPPQAVACGGSPDRVAWICDGILAGKLNGVKIRPPPPPLRATSVAFGEFGAVFWGDEQGRLWRTETLGTAPDMDTGHERIGEVNGPVQMIRSRNGAVWAVGDGLLCGFSHSSGPPLEIVDLGGLRKVHDVRLGERVPYAVLAGDLEDCRIVTVEHVAGFSVGAATVPQLGLSASGRRALTIRGTKVLLWNTLDGCIEAMHAQHHPAPTAAGFLHEWAIWVLDDAQRVTLYERPR